MTTLIAVQHKDWCLIASDSQTTGYEIAGDCSPMGKIAMNGPYLVSAAGLVRGMNLIQHSFKPPLPPKSNVDKFMVNRFVKLLRKTFIDAGYDMKDDGDVAQQDNDFIVAVRGVLYFIDGSYAVERMSGSLYATGTGMKFALGAAEALGISEVESWKDAIDILNYSVQVAIKYDIFSGGKVQMAFQSKTGKTKIAYLE